MNAIEIVDFSEKHLERGIALVESAFSMGALPRQSLSVIFYPDREYDHPGTEGVLYRRLWVAMDGETVAGITGIYMMEEDEAEADWLNWFVVARAYRRQGLGRLLVQLAIDVARTRHKRVLRLWTSDVPSEQAAQILYKDMGFAIYKKAREPGIPYTMIYWEKVL